jgi:hypothetical protein
MHLDGFVIHIIGPIPKNSSRIRSIQFLLVGPTGVYKSVVLGGQTSSGYLFLGLFA